MLLRLVLLSGLAGLSLPAFAATGDKITTDELVAKNLEARGGADKLRAITSMHTVGKMRLGGGLEAKTETFAMAPDKYRQELSLQGLTAVQSWDGQQGWTINPFEGRRDPQKLSGDDTKDLAQSADLAGPLLDTQKKGERIEYLGTEDIDGTDAHKLRVTRKNGDSVVIYLDPDQFLEIRVVTHDMIRGQEQVQTTDLGEYEKVSDVYFPFEQGQIHVEKAEANGKIDPQMFAFPTAAAKH